MNKLQSSNWCKTVLFTSFGDLVKAELESFSPKQSFNIRGTRIQNLQPKNNYFTIVYFVYYKNL